MSIKNILPSNADLITKTLLSELGTHDDETVYLSNKKPSPRQSPTQKQSTSPEKDESEDAQLDFEIYDSDAEDSNEAANPPMPTHTPNSKLENNDTHITMATSSDDTQHSNPNTAAQIPKISAHAHTIAGLDPKQAQQTPLIDDTKDPIAFGTKNGSKNATKDVGSRTMEQWLNRDNLIVHPVWIGNLPRGTTVNQLRHFVESQVGRVLVSIHISVKQPSNNERTYAFLNLPTAEKQLLAVTLLDGKIFTQEKLIVRPKRPSKFPQSFFGSSPISEHFKHFRDCVVPAILANPTINLNVTSVRKILEQNHINIDHLPNRVWCVQCTLVPQCHRTYCSFYHCHQEKELGRIISILAAQSCGGDASDMNTNVNGLGQGMDGTDAFSIEHKKNLAAANNPNTIRSRHTLLIQGLPRSITSKKIEETFEVFGEIDNVIVNPDHTCYVRMKRSQDARKIVHLFKYNHAGVIVDFAPYGASKMTSLAAAKDKKTVSKPGLNNYATAPMNKHVNNYGNKRPQMQNNRSHDGMNMGMSMGNINNGNMNMGNLPIVNPNIGQTQSMNGMSRPQMFNSQTMNSMGQTQNNYGYGYNGMAQNNMVNNVQNTQRKSARDRLSLSMHTQSEPLRQPTQTNFAMNNGMQNVQGYGNNMGMQMGNNNMGYNQYNMMQQMTPEQYTQYYNQMMQQRGYQQQQQQQQQFNGYNQSQSPTQYTFPQTQGYNNQIQMQSPQSHSQSQIHQNSVFSPTNQTHQTHYAFSRNNNALSPIAQTPQNLVNGMAQMNVSNMTSPRFISPTAVTAQQQQSNTYQRPPNAPTARQQLGLKSAYSTNDAYIPQQTQPQSYTPKATQAYDDSYTPQKYNYNPNEYNSFIQKHQQNNANHTKYLQQSINGKNDGALPNAPQVRNIPEPDLHFQLSAHDFPLSPTSALKNKQQMQ